MGGFCRISGELFETQVASLSFPCGFGKRNAGVEDESFFSDSVQGVDTGLLALVSGVLVELSACDSITSMYMSVNRQHHPVASRRIVDELRTDFKVLWSLTDCKVGDVIVNVKSSRWRGS